MERYSLKKIKVKDLKTNQVIAKAVENDKGNILLYDGAIIKSEQINKLIENNIEYVYIREEIKKSDMFCIAEIEKDAASQIKNAVELRIHTKDDTEMKEVIQTAVDIINDIVSHPEVADCMLNVKREKNDLYTHMLGVSALSTVMGIKAGFSDTELKDVATGALLHDIGLAKVEVPYDNVEVDILPAAEKLNYRRHVITGYEIVKDFAWISETSKMIVLSHHEKIDGSGYPFHKVSERIPKEVKLVSICDHFDEMVNGIGYKKRKIHEVVEYFRTNEAYFYDYEMMTMVMSSIAWFPTGSMVITNENEIARVVGQNRGLPDRPILRIVRDADGKICKKEIIKDLTELLTIFIIESIENQEDM